MHDDIWCQIFQFLDLKSIYNIEMADVFFQNVLKRIKFWNRKIKIDFPHCYDVLGELSHPNILYKIMQKSP